MKKLVYLIAILTIAISCKDNKNNYKIEGNLGGLSDQYVYLQGLEEDSFTTLDSVKAENGEFTFTGSIERPLQQYITFENLDAEITFFNEASNISEKFDKDYNTQLTGNPAEDINYYNFNKGTYTNRDIMTSVKHSFSPGLQIRGKAYYSSEDAEFSETAKRGPNNMVLDRTRDINRTGIIPEVRGKQMGIDYTLGYWYESADNNAYVYNSRIEPDTLRPMGYGFYTVNNGNSTIHNPYLKLAYNQDGLKLQGGLK